MDAPLGTSSPLFDGSTAQDIAARCDVPAVHMFEEVGSTMDVAHDLAAAGAPAGTVVLAERQVQGRGRGGHGWTTAPGSTIALSLVERPLDADAIGVLSLRLGIRVAQVLSRHAPDVMVKWPNDLMRHSAKLGGILVEARWHGGRPDWVVVGIGVNVSSSPWPGGAALDFHGSRIEILAELLPAMRAASMAEGGLSEGERAEWRRRDWAAGRAVVSPARGVVRGVESDGSLVVDGAAGPIRCTSGSLVLAEE